MTKRNNIKLETVNIYAETGDFVFCTYCGKKMLLPRGADKCPECKKVGHLSWIDGEPEEVNSVEQLSGR